MWTLFTPSTAIQYTNDIWPGWPVTYDFAYLQAPYGQQNKSYVTDVSALEDPQPLLYLEDFAGYLVCGNEDTQLREGQAAYTFSLLKVSESDPQI